MRLILLLVSMMAAVTAAGGEHWRRDAERVAVNDKLKIVITAEHCKLHAERLKRVLDAMTGGNFEITTGNGAAGIAIGAVGDFSQIEFKPQFKLGDPGEMQGFEIKSHRNGVWLIGATPQAAGYAVSEWLYDLGHRYFFPTSNWEIIPKTAKLEYAAHRRETPDYYHRQIWAGWGFWPKFRKETGWNDSNRNGGYQLHTEHVYGEFIRANKKAFDAHPEYYALRNGKRDSSKLCIANPELRKLFADWTLERFKKNPLLQSSSADPSDGGGWCECEPCVKLGSPSTRAAMLANVAAEAVSAEFKGKRIGMYAYNHHSPPPAIDVHPDVIVSVATSFIREGLALHDIIDGWAKRGAAIGIREYYYGDGFWSGMKPGAARASNFSYLASTIPDFYRRGARYMSANVSDHWGASGLGYYLIARMLWNTAETADVEALKTDFLEKSFGAAAVPMRDFYALLDGSRRRPLSHDLLGRMYRSLEAARQAASGDEAVMRRLDDLAVYTRIVELILQFTAKSDAANYSALMRFLIDTQDTRMVHSYAVFRESRYAPSNLSELRKSFDFSKVSPPTRAELEQIVKDGIAANALLDFETVEFSLELVPCETRSTAKPGKITPMRGERIFYLWADQNLAPFKLKVTGGLIKHYRSRGNVKINLYKIGGESEDGTLETLIQTDETVPPDGEAREVALQPKQPGLHRLHINDGSDQTLVEFAPDTVVSYSALQTTGQGFSGTWYFFVPKGTKVLGLYAKAQRGAIVSPSGKTLLKFDKSDGFFKVDVPAGEDNAVWKLNNLSYGGLFRLLTVPPNLSLRADVILVPEEIRK